ncbi:MAG TPA: type II toxin-antitoxin system RelE/ParE family toxin [Desulfitobacteriaceae bacterium]|nr:type II toxin-antitoxin system RelE/ParE family toxin [Desulfitobacteriaceae bacterium]
MQIFYSRIAAKVIESLDKSVRQRLKMGIEGLTKAPPVGDIKMMQGFNPPIYRLRIGKYCILYEYAHLDGEQFLLIKDIGSREDIYK